MNSLHQDGRVVKPAPDDEKVAGVPAGAILELVNRLTAIGVGEHGISQAVLVLIGEAEADTLLDCSESAS